MTYNITDGDFRHDSIPEGGLVLCDPPYGLGKVYDGKEETETYPYWVNTLEASVKAPWRLYFAPPVHLWSMDDLAQQPHRVIYWCKTFVQLRRINGWQYAVTPILVYKDEGAPWYGDPKKGHENFDWITSPSPLADLRATRRYYTGGHPGVTGTAIARKIIKVTTAPGDLVVDPMCGIGSIPVAALMEGRNAYGVEISSTYADIASRWCRDTEAASAGKVSV